MQWQMAEETKLRAQRLAVGRVREFFKLVDN